MKLKTKQLLVSVAMSLLSAIILFSSGKAQACRDCPFPIRIADHTWRMPHGHVTVDIVEVPYRSGIYVTVELRDSRSNQLLASGGGMRAPNERSVNLDLMDTRGKKVKGLIHWVSYEKSIIQARFECDDFACSLED